MKKINHSKLKNTCIYYEVAGHNIACCVIKGKPKCFTKPDQCVGCKKYTNRNTGINREGGVV